MCISAVIFTGCGSEGSEAAEESSEILENGVIEIGDTSDPNHANLLYDGFEFEAERFDRVRIEAEAGEFEPMLKLVEVETGAVLAEWESEYSSDDALLYTIAGPGIYEARIYGTEGGTGQYTLTISVEP